MEKINKIYTDPKNPGSFSTADNLIKAVKEKFPDISRRKVLEFLERNRTATLFKKARKRFSRSRTIPSDLQADLADYQKLWKENQGNRYLLLACCVLSRQVFGVPVKSKSSKDMKEGFLNLFKQMPHLPSRIYTDRGLEFESGDMKNFFEEMGIQKLAAKNSKIKAAVAERAIQTIKNRMFKYFSEANSTDWVTPLPDFLYAINHTVSRATGVTPASINTKNWPPLWEKLYGNLIRNPDIKKLKFKQGDAVRTSFPKQIFDKGYFPSRSDHIYTINETHASRPDYYTLKKDDGSKVEGRFYRPELVKTIKDDQTTYRVEKVIRTRKRKGVGKEFLIKFIGYPEIHWIKEKDLIN